MGDKDQVANPVSTADVIRMVTMSLGLAYFIVQICSDAWASLMSKPHTKWIPAKALILSALSLQILTYLDYRSVSISEVPNLHQENMLFGDQLVIDSGRLVICVFIGYLLPAMALPGSAEQWTDIAALVISVFAAVVAELYYIYETEDYYPHKTTNSTVSPEYPKAETKHYYLYKRTNSTNKVSQEYSTAWFIGSSIAILVSTVMLILFLVSAIIAGKTVRGLLTHRILHVTKPPPSKWSWDNSTEENKSSKGSLNEFKDEMLRSWLLCRVGQPSYVIARSVLSSSTGLIVTACIALVVTKGIVLRYFNSFIHRHDGWDWLRHITFSLQCAFVLMGWMVICWRWWSAMLCFSGFLSRSKSKSSDTMKSEQMSWERLVVEDFWTRSIHELRDVYDLYKWRLRLSGRSKISSGIMVSIVTALKLYRLSILFWALQMFLVLFSKSCWFVSQMVLILLGFKFMRRCRCMGGEDKSCVCSGKKYVDDEEFKKYRKALEQVCMPGESAESLWFANAKSFKQANDCLAYKASGNQANDESLCPDLKTLLQGRFSCQSVSDGNGGEPESFVDRLQQRNIGEQYQPLVEYFPFLEENNSKIIAVSLVKIIIKVFVFYDGIDHPLAKVVEAYNQAWEFMTFVTELPSNTELRANPTEVLDIEVDQVSVAADKEFQRLQQFKDKEFKRLHDSLRRDKLLTAKAAIEKLRDEAESHLIPVTECQQTPEGHDEENVNEEHASYSEHLELQDSNDWNEVAGNYYMYIVCKLVLEAFDRNINNVSELLDELHLYIADVIGKCLLKIPEVLVTRCRKWAVEYEEDDIWDALSTAGKAIKFMQEMWPGVQLVQRSNSSGDHN